MSGLCQVQILSVFPRLPRADLVDAVSDVVRGIAARASPSSMGAGVASGTGAGVGSGAGVAEAGPSQYKQGGGRDGGADT